MELQSRSLRQIVLRSLAVGRGESSFIGGYFGTREASLFLDNVEFMEGIGKRRPFFDVTAGTGQFPYALARRGRLVFVSDICPYAAAILKLWTTPDTTSCHLSRLNWLTELASKIHPDTVRPVNGYLSKSVDPEVMSEATASWLDGIATMYSGVMERWLVAKAVTRFLFRNRGWSKVDPKGRANKDVQPIELVEVMLRYAARARACREKLKGTEVWSGCFDSLVAIKKCPFPAGTSVYMDTAWPYSGKIVSANPYRVFVEILSSAMEQKQLVASHLWERSTPARVILRDVSRYIETSFERGAGQFIVTTQDTNYPKPEKVFDHFRKDFILHRMLKVRDYSSAANKPYFNYWGFLCPRE